MRGLIFAVLGFVSGFVASAAAGLGLSAVVPISQAEGAYAMQVFFFWAPLGGALGAVAGFVLGRPGGQ